MTNELTAPKRRYRLSIELQADTMEELEAELCICETSIFIDGCKSPVSGGPTASFVAHLTEDPEMTHERYMSEVKAYLKATRKGKAATP